MAKKSGTSSGNSLVIVESPAKARTIEKFLGKGYKVEASIGHVRDLPTGKKELPEKYKDEDWGYLGVNVEEDFTPVYIVPSDKKKQVSNLKAKLKEASSLYLATDEDREGEAISWHLCEVLKPKVPVKRMVFHEITETAIKEALENPRDIDSSLVKAQETRRILDRLYGFDVSQLLWRKVKRGLSAGRVQSVAVRLIVDRERERMGFKSATYWDLVGAFVNDAGESFDAQLVSIDGRGLPAGKDFDATTGKLKDDSLLLLDENGANDLVARFQNAEFRITALDEKPYTTSPAAPFTTSKLVQEANRKLGLTTGRTMSIAQSLYQDGHITYMRTDSTALADDAVAAARSLVLNDYGKEYLPDQPRVYKSKQKNAQEAHEAIRPADVGPSGSLQFEVPSAIEKTLTRDEFRLFELIWKRTVASQMTNARGRRIAITIEGDGAVFRASGKTIDFPGFLRAYVEGSDDPEAELADKEIVLPSVTANSVVSCGGMESKSHTTKAKARYTEASLVEVLDEKGIGRPSTYKSIIDRIKVDGRRDADKGYIFTKGKALVPNWTAFVVTNMFEQHLEELIDYEFTADMEDYLDKISNDEASDVDFLRGFYFGNDGSAADSGLKQRLSNILEKIDTLEVNRFLIGKPESGEHTDEINVTVGRWGPRLEQGERKTPNYRSANLPDDMPPDELTLEKSVELLEQAQVGEDPIGFCPDTQRPVFVKHGRFGPYVQLAPLDEDEKPKNASILKGISPEDVDLELALKLLSLPRTLGEHPDSKEPVEAHDGRFGPYVKCGDETRSLGDVSPLDVTLEQALQLLAQPKTRGRRRSAPKEPLKVFDKTSPVTDEAVKLLDGYYGPYVTDGTTNASLPKGLAPEELTFERALDMLAEKAAKGPSRRKKKTAKKKKAAKKKKTTAKKKKVNKKA